ncbi:hypothetical protein HZH66_001060 [Vespula vulgaris]|uniref:Uncharacterized protein n=1 Tax=Vespula vulgaris TaxID=7454 RepID=A0A834KQB1_VESVU|nr:hypothetical protein HZH66_001060 [Vespula vulgaris]
MPTDSERKVEVETVRVRVSGTMETARQLLLPDETEEETGRCESDEVVSLWKGKKKCNPGLPSSRSTLLPEHPWQETKDGEDDGSWVESEVERRMVAGVTRARNDFAKRTGEQRSSSLLIESNASSMKTVFQANICLRIFSVILGSSEESKTGTGDLGKRGVKRPRSKASSPVRQGPQQCQRIEREEKRHEEGCTKARSNDVCLALEEGPSEGERSGFWHGDDAPNARLPRKLKLPCGGTHASEAP